MSHYCVGLMLILFTIIQSLAANRASGGNLRHLLRLRRGAQRQARQSTTSKQPLCKTGFWKGSTGYCQCNGNNNNMTADCHTSYIPMLSAEGARFDSIRFCRENKKFDDKRLSVINFTSFPPVRELYLSGCALSSIASNTFEGLQNLENLYLMRNDLKDIPPNAFLNKNIRYLNLQKNPNLRLTKETFIGSKVHTLNIEKCNLRAEQLNNRSLQPLIEGAGAGDPHLRTLYVGENRLHTFDPSLRSWVQSAILNRRRAGELEGHVLGLAGNPLLCTCSLIWLSLLARDYPAYFKDLDKTKCIFQTFFWPPSNVEPLPPSSLNRTVLLSELWQYAMVLGCAPPSLSSLNMELLDKGALEFSLRVESNPEPEFMHVTREGSLKLMSDSLIKERANSSQKVAVRSTTQEFDAVGNKFISMYFVRVELNDKYVLHAYNVLGNLLFRLNTNIEHQLIKSAASTVSGLIV